jgi:hypothetical protein
MVFSFIILFSFKEICIIIKDITKKELQVTQKQKME